MSAVERTWKREQQNPRREVKSERWWGT